jgi:hypothetical protein
MSKQLSPIYEQNPAKLENLHERLNAISDSFLAVSEDQPLRHTAKFNEWDVALDTSRNGELQAASLVRAGTIEYNFVRTGDKDWAAVDARHHFKDTHFYNLVTVAVRNGLEWSQSFVPEQPS